MLREGLGPDIDIAVDFHAKQPHCRSIIIKELDPLQCSGWKNRVTGKCVGHGEDRQARQHSDRNRRALVAAHGVRELVEQSVVESFKPYQSRRRHYGFLEVAAMAHISSISMARTRAKDRSDARIASCDASIPNFLIQECCDRPCRRRATSLGRMVRFPGDAHGQRQVSVTGEARLGFDLRGSAKEIPVCRTRPIGACLS